MPNALIANEPNLNALSNRFLGIQPPTGDRTPIGLAPYGMRYDGTAPKGKGFFGPLRGTNGDVMSEYSIGMNIGGQEMEIPSFVPTLTAGELQHLLSGGDVTPEIERKAVDHAIGRIQSGRSPFAERGEMYRSPLE